MSTVDVLRGARAKLVQGWCRGWFAIGADGKKCEPDDSACKVCLMGALIVASGGKRGTSNTDYFGGYQAVKKYLESIGVYSVSQFNDQCGYVSEVLDVVDKAIAMCEIQEA